MNMGPLKDKEESQKSNSMTNSNMMSHSNASFLKNNNGPIKKPVGSSVMSILSSKKTGISSTTPAKRHYFLKTN